MAIDPNPPPTSPTAISIHSSSDTAVGTKAKKTVATMGNSNGAQKSPTTPRGGKRDRPCDSCRKRKSKCVVTDSGRKCAACVAQDRECTYVEDPQPRKRKITGSNDGKSSTSCVATPSIGVESRTATTGSARSSRVAEQQKRRCVRPQQGKPRNDYSGLGDEECISDEEDVEDEDEETPGKTKEKKKYKRKEGLILSRSRSAASPTSDMSSSATSSSRNPQLTRQDAVHRPPAIPSRRNTNRSSHHRRKSSAASSSAISSPFISSSQYYGTHIGPTTELEPVLLGMYSESAAAAVVTAPSSAASSQLFLPQPPLSATGETFQTRGRTAFLVDQPAIERSRASYATALRGVERLAHPHGPALRQIFCEMIQPNFPVVDQAFFAECDAGGSMVASSLVDPTLLAAVYILSLPWLTRQFFAKRQQQVIKPEAGYGTGPSFSVPDSGSLEEMAFGLFAGSLATPTLSTIQAGLLLMQRPGIDTKTLNTQLVSAAHELGLQVDCTGWGNVGVQERGLRKRLAWALYMQDKWCALIHGRPSQIGASNWAVRDLDDEDFEIPQSSGESSSLNGGSEGDIEMDEGEEDTNVGNTLDDNSGTIGLTERREDQITSDIRPVHRSSEELGREMFRQMIQLTKILSTILDTFYTLKAMQEVENAGSGGTRLILDRAKPVQIRLKEWFSGLPTELKMDAKLTGRPSFTGYMHLAYFATEITLHRCIVRSLAPSSSSTVTSPTSPPASSPPSPVTPAIAGTTTMTTTDGYLAHICRSAAKTRLISAMDFVNRLRVTHLRAFWYFSSRVFFALVGTFGALLLATAPCREEADFYHTRLREYRWTLGVSGREEPSLMALAAETMDASDSMLRALPDRPSTTEVEIEEQQRQQQQQLEQQLHPLSSVLQGRQVPQRTLHQLGQNLSPPREEEISDPESDMDAEADEGEGLVPQSNSTGDVLSKGSGRFPSTKVQAKNLRGAGGAQGSVVVDAQVQVGTGSMSSVVGGNMSIPNVQGLSGLVSPSTSSASSSTYPDAFV